MQLKITNADGSTIYSDDVVKVTVSSAGRITEVIYGATTVSAIPTFAPGGILYEVGLLGESGVMNAWLSNR